MRLLCLMHKSSERGHLLVGGVAPTLEQLTRMTGWKEDELKRDMTELRRALVYSITDGGVIFSRRMTRDEHKRIACSEAGKRGGGNPTYKGQPGAPLKVVPKVPPKGAYKGTSKRTIGNGIGIGSVIVDGSVVVDKLPTNLRTEAFCAALLEWVLYRREIRHAVTARPLLKQIKQMSEMGPERAIAMIDHTITQGWQGLFEPERRNGNDNRRRRQQKSGREYPEGQRDLPEI
jgi:hypothetical protein